MVSKVWSLLGIMLTGSSNRARRLRPGEAIGFVILTFAAWLYLGTYVGEIAVCLVDIGEELFTNRRLNLQCLDSVLDDLRDDSTAATVILAIAAAMLARAWSSGSRSEG